MIIAYHYNIGGCIVNAKKLPFGKEGPSLYAFPGPQAFFPLSEGKGVVLCLLTCYYEEDAFNGKKGMAPWQNATKHGSMQSQCIATFAWSNYRRKINMLALLLANHRKEEAYMQYINAKALLPDALVKELRAICRGAIFMFPLTRRRKNNGEKYPVTEKNYSSGTGKSKKHTAAAHP